MGKADATAGIYSATYSGIPVWEFQFGPDLKEHVMRRRHDDWINATHILKAAGFDKPARTRILEREVQKDVHEKIQGGYGKYQGTWIPLEQGENLARRNNVYDRIQPIFEFRPGNESPPPAPRHTSKPKAAKARPAVPKWSSKSQQNSQSQRSDSFSQSTRKGAAPAAVQDEYDNGNDALMHEDDTPDNLTVASASYMAEDDRYDASHFSTHRKRKREEMMQDLTEQQHAMYGDELLDYFLLSRNEQPAIRPDPPTNFQPDWPIDGERHTALHWASAMGDVEVIRQLKRFNANLASQNIRGETPFMRSVNFTNCYEKDTFPLVMKELFSTVEVRDNGGCTVIHHAAVMKSGRVTSQSCSRYYLDHILNKLMEKHHPDFVQQLIDAQDNEGNTAVHLAAMRDARKCIRALLGRGASTDIPNHDGVRAEDLIKELNASKSKIARSAVQRSSSPFGPDTAQRQFREAVMPGSADGLGAALIPGDNTNGSSMRMSVSYQSEAANTVTSRITPLVLQKLQDLAQSYDDEFKEKDEAEREARRILLNTQAELQNIRTQIADLEARVEPEEIAAKTGADADAARQKVLDYITYQNRVALQVGVDEELSAANGAAANGDTGGDDAAEARIRLAQELQTLLTEQRRTEEEYVDARGMLGTGENIDKYRHLLKSCLPPEDQEMLDENLEDLIKMMEDDVEPVIDGVAPPSMAGVPGGGAMELTAM
ncbi:putative transcription factor mbp1 protein [Diplogelasinospora grovesii]|uniref:Transcription factor mbp1 protein n=1 Tax=Diplogelasinospora grovesii TaxID=303347 RepID=A0AAN6S0Z6_9PEZI|nr:putative transcription factor mbp1 protein [Diplogelasinospora grovesii]